MRMATSPNSFIQAYLDRGFGSMTKNDFEVMIFAELLQTSLLNKSNYDISVDLRIPETKVKRLRYEASLKYNILSEQDLRDKFRNAVNAANVENNKVIMTIEDIALIKYIDSRLKKQGKYFNTSHNNELVIVNFKDFADLLEAVYYADSEFNQIKSKLNKKKFKDFIENLLQQSTFKMVDFAFNRILTLI